MRVKAPSTEKRWLRIKVQSRIVRRSPGRRHLEIGWGQIRGPILSTRGDAL